MNKLIYSDHENKLERDLGLKEKSAIELFYEKPCECTLSKVLKQAQTLEMLELAIAHDGNSIKSASKRLLSYDLCVKAVQQNGEAIQYVPQKWITLPMAFDAVRNCPNNLYSSPDYPIRFIPDTLLNEELIFESVRNSPLSLKNIPERFFSEKLFLLAVSLNGDALEYIPTKYHKKELTLKAITSKPTSLKFIPKNKRLKTVCYKAFELNPLTIQFIPHKIITLEMCLKAIERYSPDDNTVIFTPSWFPSNFLEDKMLIDAIIEKSSAESLLLWNNKNIEKIKTNPELKKEITPLSKKIVSYIKKKATTSNTAFLTPIKAVEVATPEPSNDAKIVKRQKNNSITYDLTTNDNNSVKVLYYISDIHLEHQMIKFIEPNKHTYENEDKFIRDKISEMIASVSGINGTLLIGGDVADTRRLEYLFYKNLSLMWQGDIISVLGNHELWDNHPKETQDDYVSRPIDDIVNDYRVHINSFLRCFFLHNALYIDYKNQKKCIIEEEQIINATDEDLKDICSKATLIILGGLGYSGLNPIYNAEMGLYSFTVTSIEQDKELSEQFKFIYDKLIRCAGDKQVIVLTHTPVDNWTTDEYNPNWVYINGHTHTNSIIRKSDGTTVLSDNQVGYKPSKMHLNRFYISGWYDPFKNLNSGIYEITSAQYKDFNQGRSIHSNGCNYPGTIYMLKRNELYMFLLKSGACLRLLVGGQPKRLRHHDITYYYDNMELYSQKIQQALKPYHDALEMISAEVKKFGGCGKVHGCIIDIDFFNHIYLNPFDGKVSAYFAYDITSRYVYSDILTLLRTCRRDLISRFLKCQQDGSLPLLDKYAVNNGEETKNLERAKIPDLVLGTEIYEPSRTMRSIQYIFEKNVIRIWEDKVLNFDFGNYMSITGLEEKSSPEQKH